MKIKTLLVAGCMSIICVSGVAIDKAQAQNSLLYLSPSLDDAPITSTNYSNYTTGGTPLYFNYNNTGSVYTQPTTSTSSTSSTSSTTSSYSFSGSTSGISNNRSSGGGNNSFAQEADNVSSMITDFIWQNLP